MSFTADFGFRSGNRDGWPDYMTVTIDGVTRFYWPVNRFALLELAGRIQRRADDSAGWAEAIRDACGEDGHGR